MNLYMALMVFSGVLSVVALVPYARSIIKGETKPAKATWLIWAILDTMVFAGMLAEGTLNGQMPGVIVGTWVVLALAMKYGTPGWTRLDKLCLGATSIGIVLWLVFNNPVWSIVVALSVMSVGSAPTFVSTWRDYTRENKLAWTLVFVSSVAAVLAIPGKWTLANAAQPIVFLAISVVMMFLLHIKPKLSVM